MYQQQVHQGLQQGVAPHPAYQGQQHFPDNAPYSDGNMANAGSMACLYQNYQVGKRAALSLCSFANRGVL